MAPCLRLICYKYVSYKQKHFLKKHNTLLYGMGITETTPKLIMMLLFTSAMNTDNPFLLALQTVAKTRTSSIGSTNTSTTYNLPLQNASYVVDGRYRDGDLIPASLISVLRQMTSPLHSPPSKACDLKVHRVPLLLKHVWPSTSLPNYPVHPT